MSEEVLREDDNVQEKVAEEVIEEIESEEEQEDYSASEEEEEGEDESTEGAEDEGEGSNEEDEEEVESLEENVSRVFPEREFESQEEMLAAHMKYTKQLESYVEKAQQANMVLNERVNEDPDFGQFLSDIVQDGIPWRVAIAKNFSAEDLFPQEGEPDYDELQRIVKEQKQRAKEMKAYQIQLAENRNQSEQAISEFKKEKNLTDDTAQAFFKDVDSLLQDIAQFKVTKEALAKLYDAMNYQKDLKAAETKGVIKGRNEKILKVKAKPKKVDNLPETQSTSEELKTPPVRPRSKWIQAVSKHTMNQ